jgi:hypothetical protein
VANLTLKQKRDLQTDSMFLDIADEDVNWLYLLDVIQSQPGVGTDANTARILGVSRAQLDSFRKQKVKSLGMRAQVRILDVLGYMNIKHELLKYFDLESQARIENRNEAVASKWEKSCKLKPLPIPKEADVITKPSLRTKIAWQEVKPLGIDLVM